MDLRDIFEQHCDWIQPGTTVLRKGDPQENISARKDLLTKFNGCSSDICINEGEKKKDPSLMEKEYPWVVKGLKAHTRQVGRLWLEPREPECTGTLTTADCLWLMSTAQTHPRLALPRQYWLSARPADILWTLQFRQTARSSKSKA
ncbi:uncharacterized protein LOC129634267 isoform X6 [Bubalus kerabau]|uniref:uncharacterized protein LOC129634267 isoform X6 n=1 Tax=Bubalus carabanensis TaxID=3119969 RepID=UPI00244E91F2|nr:uncharacterized protein LOC129634267 isoform X6 [Bubalus carabanensis]